MLRDSHSPYVLHFHKLLSSSSSQTSYLFMPPYLQRLYPNPLLSPHSSSFDSLTYLQILVFASQFMYSCSGIVEFPPQLRQMCTQSLHLTLRSHTPLHQPIPLLPCCLHSHLVKYSGRDFTKGGIGVGKNFTCTTK